MNFKASIIIPVYNEVNFLETLCFKLKESFQNIKVKYIFIDDGSSDGSCDWLTKNLHNYFNKKELNLISLKKNYGKGYAIREGIKKLEGTYAIFIDSDMEYDPKDIFEMYEVVLKNKNINVLYGSRNLGTKIQLRKYFLNSIAVKFNTFVFNFLFNQSLTDLHTGSKIVESSLLKNLDLNTDGFAIEVVMSSEISKKEINIYEYGISYLERTVEQGKKITFIDGVKSYFFLFRERFIKNDLYTIISLLYSILFMTYAGSHFGMGMGKILIVILFIIIGLLIALSRRIIPLSIVFGLIYIGSLFSKGNGKIYTVVIFFLLGLYLSKKTKKFFLVKRKNFIQKLLI